jgi:Flp pilus assembly pilin Flp
VEYALVTAVMAVLGVSIMTILNTRLETVFSAVSNELDTAQSSH